jgi:hypothetical protein
MIRQVLLFTFKPDVTESDIEKLFEEYKKLIRLTPLLSIEAGRNISKEGFDQGYTHVAIASFADKESVHQFLEHPDHLAFADGVMNPLLKDFLLIEIEI